MYLDTSVVVKLFTREADSVACEQRVEGHRIVSSELLYAELWSALLAKERAGVLKSDARMKAWDLFETLLLDETIELIRVDAVVVRDAAEIMAVVHPPVPLRTSDALHLATFAAIEAGPLFTRDRRMLDAARRLNLPLAE